jgi:hypothetical protein
MQADWCGVQIFEGFRAMWEVCPVEAGMLLGQGELKGQHQETEEVEETEGNGVAGVREEEEEEVEGLVGKKRKQPMRSTMVQGTEEG